MDNTYRELASFKYEANLLFTESVLSENHIPFKTINDLLFGLSVKPEDYEKASALVQSLNLDENEVDEENDGYIAGYEEWAEKRFVTGYFTGGVIPRWMFNKTYAKWFGPVNLITGLCYLYTLQNESIRSAGAIGILLICVLYIVCGVLLTIRGFKKQPA